MTQTNDRQIGESVMTTKGTRPADMPQWCAADPDSDGNAGSGPSLQFLGDSYDPPGKTAVYSVATDWYAGEGTRVSVLVDGRLDVPISLTPHDARRLARLLLAVADVVEEPR